MARRLERFEHHRNSIEQEVCRLIAGAGRRIPKEIRLVRAESGVSTLTFFVDCDGDRSYVLRCLLRRREVRYLPATYAFCQQNGIATPRLLGGSDGIWRRFRVGFYLFLEEFIKAEPIETVLRQPDRQKPAVDGLARCLAGLHDFARKDYGPIPKADPHPYLAYYLKKAIQKLQRIRTTVHEISEEETRSLARYLLEQSGQCDPMKRFSLVHGDPSDGNVLVDRANHVTLVDLEYMHFGVYQYDLQMIRHYLLEEDDDLFERFMKTYLSLRKSRAEESPTLDALTRLFVLLRSLSLQSEAQGTQGWWEQWRKIRTLAGF